MSPQAPPVTPSDLVDHGRRLAHTHAERAAFTWLADGEQEQATLTFEDIDREARRVAVLLERRGVAPGARALLLYAPGLEFIAAFLGCLYARVVAVPLSAPRTEASAATVLAIVRDADAAIVLTDSIVMGSAVGKHPLFRSLPYVVTDDAAEQVTDLDFWRPGQIDPNDLAFLQYTSGSTGAPKGVEVSHANLVRNEEMIREGFGHDAQTVFAGWLPLFHDMGLVGNVLQPFFLGIQSVLMAPASFVQKPVRWLRAITRYRATTAGGPNFGYELCVRRIRREQLEELDLSSWKVAYNGSEPIRAETLRDFEAKFGPVGFSKETFFPCYGMAEASLFVTGPQHDRPFAEITVDAAALQEHRIEPVAAAGDADETPEGAQRLVSCGKPYLDQRVIIVDPETRVERPEGTVGEVWMQGGNIARGYRGQPTTEPDPFRAKLANGEGPFLRSGDLGFLRAGELFVTGRIKDLIILKGQNHYPQDLELVAAGSHAHLRVDFSAAFSVEDEREPRLVIVQEVHRRVRAQIDSAEAALALHEELTGCIRQAVARAYDLRVSDVVLVEHGSIPKTSSGKIQRRQCQALWRRGELSDLRTALSV